jgi:3',5'-cyclic-AMP phosphodiesterase
VSRIAIIADVHLGLPETQFPGQDYTYAQKLLPQAVQAIAALNPDRVVIVGDLVNMGTEAEYVMAKDLLSPLADRIEPMIGNHELVRGSVADFRRAWGVEPYRRITLGGLPAVILNSGVEGLPMTEWRGRLNAQQYQMLDEILSVDSPLLIFCHHPIAGTVRRSDELMMGLDDSPELLARLERRRQPTVLITGHTHHANIQRRGHITFVGCPSLCFWPHAFLVAEIGSRSIDIRTIALMTDPADSPDRRNAMDPTERPLYEGQPVDRAVSIAP